MVIPDTTHTNPTSKFSVHVDLFFLSFSNFWVGFRFTYLINKWVGFRLKPLFLFDLPA